MVYRAEQANGVQVPVGGKPLDVIPIAVKDGSEGFIVTVIANIAIATITILPAVTDRHPATLVHRAQCVNIEVVGIAVPMIQGDFTITLSVPGFAISVLVKI